MKILFFDTTQDWINISLSIIEINSGSEFKIIYEKIEFCPKESSYRLVSEIQKALITFDWRKPDRIVCLTGPGSFTGIRISVSTARNLSQLWNIPVIGIDSLDAYATYYFKKFSLPIFLALDGKQNKYYFGHKDSFAYSGSSDLDEEGILKEIEKFEKNKHLFVFSGKIPICFPNNSIKIEETLPQSMHILKDNIEEIMKLQFDESNFQHLTPNYIRGSYIETNKK